MEKKLYTARAIANWLLFLMLEKKSLNYDVESIEPMYHYSHCKSQNDIVNNVWILSNLWK